MLRKFHLNFKKRLIYSEIHQEKKILSPLCASYGANNYVTDNFSHASQCEKKNQKTTCIFWSTQSCETHVLNKLKL